MNRIGVLFVCTGNQCRSPMAAAMLGHRLASRRQPVVVASAGLIGGGVPAPPYALETMSEIGLDVSGHRSRSVDAAMISASDLVVGMAREHLIELALMAPESRERCFTFGDLLRRAAISGPRRPGEGIAAWARRLGAGRKVAAVFDLPVSDDVNDPVGGSRRDFDATRDVLDGMTARLARLLASA